MRELNMYEMTQADEILLLAVNSINEGFTRFDAVNKCHCFELSARICDLKKQGWKFDAENLYVQRKNRRLGTNIRRYRLDSTQLNNAIKYLESRYGDAC